MRVSGRARNPVPHVLLVVENLPMGQDHRVSKQVPDLLEAGYEVTVLTRRDDDNARFAGTPGLTIRDYPSPPEPGSAVGYLWEYGVSFGHATRLALATRLRRRIDVVQFCQPPDLYFPLAWLLRLLGAKVLVDQRDLMPELLAKRQERPPALIDRGLRWLERRTQHAADATLCVNEYLRGRLVAAGSRPERVTIVRNGPVLDRVRRAERDEALLDGHASLCCWVGKMGRQDRLDLALHAIAHVVHDLGMKDVRFVLLGDGECLAEGRALCAELGLDPWVSLPGWVPERDVFAHLATADVGLDASLQEEVSPVKVLEYMAFGVPFVAFDLRETRAIGEGAGVLVAPGDVEALARALVGLLNDPARRSLLGRAGRERVRDDLAWDHQGAIYLRVLDRLTGRASRSERAIWAQERASSSDSSPRRSLRPTLSWSSGVRPS